MRKLIILIFILNFTITIMAQTWCAQGAQWHYRVYNSSYPYADGYIQLNNTGTVTVGGKVCDNLVGNRYGVFIFSGAPSTTVNGYINLQTYKNNNVVYLYNTETLVFDTIVDYNATIGNTWLLTNYPASLNTSSCNFSRPKCTVINTGTVVINAQTLKTIELTSQLYSQTYTISLVEKIGTITGFLFPYYHCIIDGPSYGGFVCYSDNNFALYNPSGVACNYTTVGLNEFASTGSATVKVYPNPFSNQLTINTTSNELKKLIITNPLGQQVYQTTFNQNNITLDLPQLQSGAYIATLYLNNQFNYRAKLIKQ